ncbi:MAG: hypothetical protein ACJ748_17395 [Flavisolibacter sp.]
MIKQVKHQDLDLWDAWVEYDHENPFLFGILYVMGDIIVDNNRERPVIKKIELTNDPSQLTLAIPLNNKLTGGCVKEVIYSEAVNDLNLYSSISIYAGDELVVTLNDIEVMI